MVKKSGFQKNISKELDMAWISRQYILDEIDRLIEDDAGGIGLRAVLGLVRDSVDNSLWWAHSFDAQDIGEAVVHGFRVVGGGLNDIILIRWTSTYDGRLLRVSFWLSPSGSEHPWYALTPFEILTPFGDYYRESRPTGGSMNRLALCSVRPAQPAPVDHWNQSLEAEDITNWAQHYLEDNGSDQGQIFSIESDLVHWWAHPAVFRNIAPTTPWLFRGPFTLNGSVHDEFSTGVTGVRALVARVSFGGDMHRLQSLQAQEVGFPSAWIRYGIRVQAPHDMLVVEYNAERYAGRQVYAAFLLP